MSKIYGVVTGKVTSEPDELGRVRLQLPWLGGKDDTYLAPIATLMTGAERGSWVMPEIGDDALVAFEQGDVEHPYVIGFLWNGEARPPSTDRQLRLIHSVNGHEIAIYDPDIAAGDMGYVQIRDAQGNEVVLANATVTIRSVGTINIQAPNVIINGRPVLPAPRPI